MCDNETLVRPQLLRSLVFFSFTLHFFSDEFCQVGFSQVTYLEMEITAVPMRHP